MIDYKSEGTEVVRAKQKQEEDDDLPF